MSGPRDHRRPPAPGGSSLSDAGEGGSLRPNSGRTGDAQVFYDADGRPLDQKTLKTAALNLRRQLDARRRDIAPEGPYSAETMAMSECPGRVQTESPPNPSGARSLLADDNPTLILRTLPPEAQALVEEARRVEALRLAEEARLAEETRLAEQARLAEEFRQAEEARLAEKARLA